MSYVRNHTDNTDEGQFASFLDAWPQKDKDRLSESHARSKAVKIAKWKRLSSRDRAILLRQLPKTHSARRIETSLGLTAKLTFTTASLAAFAAIAFLLYLIVANVNQSSFYVGTVGAVAAIYFVASLGLLILGTILAVSGRFVTSRGSKDRNSIWKSWKVNLAAFLLGNIIASIITHIRLS